MFSMQEISSTIRAIAETCVATVIGFQPLLDVPKGVVSEDDLQKDEV